MKYVCPCRAIRLSLSVTSRVSVLVAQCSFACLTGVEISPLTFYIPVTFLQFQPDPIDGSTSTTTDEERDIARRDHVFVLEEERDSVRQRQQQRLVATFSPLGDDSISRSTNRLIFYL